jgi:ADP-ribose pyrophosphatase
VSDFTKADVMVERRETVFQGFYRVDKLQLRHRQFRGGEAPLIRRELFVRHPAVGVLVYDPNTDEVLLNAHPWQMEIVAGLIEPGESLEEVARRETQEEAGVTLYHLERVMEFLPSPGGSDERFTLYAGLADLTHAGGVHGVPEEGEDIRVNVISLNQAMTQVANGRINNAACIIALQWLSLHKSRLLPRWKSLA